MARDSIEKTGLRTQMVGGLRAEHAGERATLTGWVHRRRDLGGLLFFDLRDRSGLVQVSFGPEWTEAESLELAHRIGHEDVVGVEGVVALRPEGARNDEMSTGEIEFRAERVRIFSDARTPEIPVYRAPEDELPAEELRLQHGGAELPRPARLSGGRDPHSHEGHAGGGEGLSRAEQVRIFSDARTPEIPVYRAPEDELPAEELRLQH
ncbi:MAG: hypothetical protein AMS19_05735, partial [Gemmatimonas sp. SG8_23]